MTTDGYELVVHVRPGGHRDGVDGVYDGVVSVRVTAPPTEGRANDAVCRVLAGEFGVRPRSVRIVSGATSRRKRVRIDGDRAALEAVHRSLLGDDASGR